MSSSEIYRKQHDDLLGMATNIASHLKTDFIKETTALFGALQTRIDKENSILYPLLDTL